MPHTPNHTVSAIVPAFNEAGRIGQVLEILTSYPHFLEVIVVDDGSTDNTAEIAKRFNVKYIRNKTNIGKGQSMDKGVRAARGDVIFFCDADVRGLRHDVIDTIVSPVTSGTVDMFIGMRNRKIYYLRFILNIIPLLGGERALTKKLWVTIPDQYKDRFKIEAALNFYAKHYSKGFGYAVFAGMSQTIKEKKYGYIPGFKRRVAMFYEVIRAQLELQAFDMPDTVRALRIALATSLASAGGVAFGALVIAAAYLGPRSFLLRIFANELSQDPDAPVVNFLLQLAGSVSLNAIYITGAVIASANILVILALADKLQPAMRSLMRKKGT